METLLMKGKPVADAYRETVSAKITAAKEKGIKVTLAIIVVGDDPASHVYKDRLVKLVESLGGEAKVLAMPETATQEEVIAAIKKLNHNRYVTGILPMMPMPKHIDGDAVGAAITMSKDVDCLNPKSVGEVFLGRSRWAPCTPRACMAPLPLNDFIKAVGKAPTKPVSTPNKPTMYPMPFTIISIAPEARKTAIPTRKATR